MRCIVCILGKNLDVNKLSLRIGLENITIKYKGEKIGKRIRDYSSITLPISKNEDFDLQEQISDAIRFLRENKKRLEIVKSFPNIDFSTINFGVHYQSKQDAVHGAYFPKELVELCSILDLGIEISFYS
ncbi:hypothetical protein [Pedobacter sp.]|uniref:hypothetical protein n=1 Tax=Pedobacter sp. TaxID=1411316 RepID=UPI00396CFC98